MEFTGKVTTVLPLVSGVSKKSGREWKAQNFCVQTDGQYPRTACFKLFGGKVDDLLPQVGDTVTVSFDIDAHEYGGRWYNEISAWNVQKLQAQQAQQPPQQYAPQQAAPPQEQQQAMQSAWPNGQPVPPNAQGDSSDLPF